MNTNSQLDKIEKVLAKIPSRELKDFMRLYALTHDDLATALVEKYWKPERGNCKEMVEACFAHVGESAGIFGLPSLDWRRIEQDLTAVMKKANGMVRRGNLIDAALTAGYVLTTTCYEFSHDHRNYTPVRYDVWAEENKVLRGIVEQAADMVRGLLITGEDIEEDSRLGILGEIAERCEEIGDNYFMRLTWLVDEAMPLLCGEDEQAYMAHISKRLKSLKRKKEEYFRYRYILQKADYWIAHGKRAQAEKLMMEQREEEHVRDHYIDCLIEWKEYRKAVELIDDNTDHFECYCNNWEEKLVKILKLSGDREWLIGECRKRLVSSGYKLKYYEALKEYIAKEEWHVFLLDLWDEVDWKRDYEEAEAKMAIQEKMLDRMRMFFVHKSWQLWEMIPRYIKYVPKSDQPAVAEMLIKDIKRLALLDKKPKEFASLLQRVESVMGFSRIVDNVIREGIRELMAENPDKVYIKGYLGSLV